MTCADFEGRLSAYLDGELSRWTRWKVQNHLRQCEECAALKSDMEAVDAAFLGCREEAPEYLTSAVMHRLPAMPPAWRPVTGSRAWSAALVLAGVQVLALGGAYWWGFAHGTDRTPAGGTSTGSVVSPSIFGAARGPQAEPSGRPRGSAPAPAPAATPGVWSGIRGQFTPSPETFNTAPYNVNTNSPSSPPAPVERRIRQSFPAGGPVFQPSGVR